MNAAFLPAPLHLRPTSGSTIPLKHAHHVLQDFFQQQTSMLGSASGGAATVASLKILLEGLENDIKDFESESSEKKKKKRRQSGDGQEGKKRKKVKGTA